MNDSADPIDRLVSDLSSRDYRVRARAARALGASRDRRAFEPLVGALGDRLPTIRLAALAALARLRDRRVIDSAIALLDDEDSKVRGSAASLLKILGASARVPILDAYRSGTPRARFTLLTALAKIRLPEATDLLLDALEGPDESHRMEAARILADRKEPRALPTLIRLATTEGSYRFAYIRALGALGDPGAFEPLRALLDEPGFNLSGEVVVALRRIDNARAVDLLHERLADETDPGTSHLAATLAVVDLMNTTTALVRASRSKGDPGLLARASASVLQALAIQARLSGTTIRERFADLDDTALIREVEQHLRQLAGGNSTPRQAIRGASDFDD